MEIISWLIAWQVSYVQDSLSTFKAVTEERRTKRRRALMRRSGVLQTELCLTECPYVGTYRKMKGMAMMDSQNIVSSVTTSVRSAN
jgi:hypothetical protein